MRSLSQASRSMSVICAFRFEVRPEDELVEIENGRNHARICENCLILITVHRRIHHMNLEEIIPQMAKG